MHHIIQEADGGPNTLENAIALCLSCHAEAGHFNSRHPLGTKYSPKELRRHRAVWWAAIESGRVIPPYNVQILWKRTHLSQALHTYRLIFQFANGDHLVTDWKLHILFPAKVTVRTQNLSDLDYVRIEGRKYSRYEVTGGKIFPGEEAELVGLSLTFAEYDVDDELYEADRDGKMTFRWILYSSSSTPLEGFNEWRNMHEF